MFDQLTYLSGGCRYFANFILKNVDAIYLDFAKAFDKVPHQRLATKVRAHGIGGPIYDWIVEWLRERKQVVRVNSCASEQAEVLSGVPQGSVLGPLLFLIFVNDMDDQVTSHLLKFADDTKLYLPLKNESSHATLQEDLNRLCQWSQEWQMLFNVSKCTTLHFGHNNPGHAYTMLGTALTRAEEVKDLGVRIVGNLKPSNQCIAAAKKANQALGMIYRNISNKSAHIIKKLYIQLVRPHLEYAVQAWSPWLKKDIELLESVQRRATRMITGFGELSYKERLGRLNLTTLEERRSRGDRIEAFKILKGLEDVEAERFFNLAADTRTRGHSLKIRKPHARLDVRKFFFSHRVVDGFNAISPRAAQCNSVLDFKKATTEGERAIVRR